MEFHTIEENCGQLDYLFARTRVVTPAYTSNHQDLDSFELLHDDVVQLYESFNGIR
jgi:hypothetical protein